MEYPAAANSRSATNCAPSTALPLDRIGSCADRVERLAFTVKSFTERFHNGPEEKVANSDNIRGVPIGYKGQIDRLTDAIDTLDNAVQALGEIG